MYIKRFRRAYEPVPDPLHPARTVQRPVLIPVPVTGFVYTDQTGRRVELTPDEEGGFEVPESVGADHIRFRTPDGEGWYPESSLVDQRRLGRVQEPVKRGPGRPRKEETE